MSRPRASVLILIILLAAFARLIPHPFNATPITAIALFGGAQFSNRKLAYITTLSAMILSDIFLGGYHRLLPLVYVYFMVVVAAGSWLREHKTPLAIAGTTLACSIVFFMITNFAVWLNDRLYPMTFDGLAQCFAAAIPFFHNTVLGDGFFVVVLFGGFALAEKRFPILQIQNS